MAADTEGSVFELLVICTANRFRSPVAEAFLRRATEGLSVNVRSLGVNAAGRLPPIDGAITEAANLGVDVSGHRAQQLQGENLEGVDLVLGFEGIHIAGAVVECGAPRERAFTMLELASVLEHMEPPLLFDPVARARRLVAQAHMGRLSTRAANPAFEFADPLWGPESAYPTVVSRIAELAERIVAKLFGSPGAGRRQ